MHVRGFKGPSRVAHTGVWARNLWEYGRGIFKVWRSFKLLCHGIIRGAFVILRCGYLIIGPHDAMTDQAGVAVSATEVKRD